MHCVAFQDFFWTALAATTATVALVGTFPSNDGSGKSPFDQEDVADRSVTAPCRCCPLLADKDNLLAARRLIRAHGCGARSSPPCRVVGGILSAATGRHPAWRRLVNDVASHFIDPRATDRLAGQDAISLIQKKLPPRPHASTPCGISTSDASPTKDYPA
jgi:hypothetical protein